MKIKSLGLCRGDGKLYIKAKTSCTFPVEDAAATLQAGSVALPSGIYPFNPQDKSTDTWVLEVPIPGSTDAMVEISNGKNSHGSLPINFERAKWESRVNYRLRKTLCAHIRDYEQGFTDNRYQIAIMRFLEGDNCIIWRLKITWSGPADAKPIISGIDQGGHPFAPKTYFFEFQEGTHGDKPHALFVSAETPVDMKQFTLQALNEPKASYRLQPGFCNINPAVYEVFKYASWKHMKDARADDAAYAAWLNKHQARSEELEAQRSRKLEAEPLFSIIVPCFQSNEAFFTDAVGSVLKQSYQNWELLLMDASPQNATVKQIATNARDARVKYHALKENGGIVRNTNEGIVRAKGEYIAFLDHDDLLEPDALFCYAEAISEESPDVLFCDEDLFEKEGDFKQPVFKTRLNVDLLYSHNCVTHFLAVKKSLADQIGLSAEGVSGAQDYDLTLRALAAGATFKHVPRVLYHWRIHEGSTSGDSEGGKPYAEEAGRLALQRHFEQKGIRGSVETTDHPFVYRMRYALPDPLPLVSIIIPNKDHAEMLDQCVSSLLETATYPNLEVVVVENNSTEEDTFAYYEKMQSQWPNVKISTWAGPFNYSAIINYGAKNASGEYLLLLNNDTKVITPDFIEEMMGYSQRPEVGVVGAKLFFRDQLTQHAGILIGPNGAIAHANQDFPDSREGYLGRAVRPGNFSAVTGACQLVKKDTFLEIGGYDESFAVGFNDADFCLRLGKAGYLTVFTPYAKLYHYEFVSRGREEANKEKMRRWENERNRFKNRWSGLFKEGDPFSNPNLDPNSAYYSL